MAWIAKDDDGSVTLFSCEPVKYGDEWLVDCGTYIDVPRWLQMDIIPKLTTDEAIEVNIV